MQIFDITIAANISRPLEAPGTYFYYYSGSAGGADSTIVLKEDTKGTTIQLKPGQAFRLPIGSPQATRWYISNYANAATIVGTVVIGDGEITDNRITGSVEVIDGGKARTLTNTAFMGGAGIAAVAAQYAAIQLWNPAGSGKNVIVEKFEFGSNLTAYAYFHWRNAALSTLVGGVTSKQTGGATSTAQLYKETNAALVNTNNWVTITTTGTASVQRVLSEPIVVKPGYGLTSICGIVNQDNSSVFEFYEESST